MFLLHLTFKNELKRKISFETNYFYLFIFTSSYNKKRKNVFFKKMLRKVLRIEAKFEFQEQVISPILFFFLFLSFYVFFACKH